jgi:hypothetical protein
VHLGLSPIPKEAESPTSAISLVESYLSGNDDDDPYSLWRIKWRRDDFYPDNFCDYTHSDLEKELQKNGFIVLQLIKEQSDDLPIMGEVANIFTADLEKKNDEEAEFALENLKKTHLDIHGESHPFRRRIAASKKNKN